MSPGCSTYRCSRWRHRKEPRLGFPYVPRTLPEAAWLGSKFLPTIYVCAASRFHYFGVNLMRFRFSALWMARVGLVAFGYLPGNVAANDWPHWRGPNFNGISMEKHWASQWPAEGPKTVWKGSVGTGFSSVSVAQGKLYTLGYGDEKETVFCFDANSGKVLWQHSYDSDL